MAHRNRWFTWVYLLKMGGFSMAMLVITRWYMLKLHGVIRIIGFLRFTHQDYPGLLPWSGGLVVDHRLWPGLEPAGDTGGGRHGENG